MQYLLSLLPFLATAAFASPVIKQADNQLIQSTLSGRCLSPPSGAAGVAVGAIGIETNVVTVDCNDAAAWNISPGSGSVILSGTDYTLDAGENPGSTGGLKVSDNIGAVLIILLYTSYPGLQQQTWYLTDDNHIAITGGNQCLTETGSGPNYTPCGSSAGGQGMFARTK
jgi:hypothetical protein